MNCSGMPVGTYFNGLGSERAKQPFSKMTERHTLCTNGTNVLK